MEEETTAPRENLRGPNPESNPGPQSQSDNIISSIKTLLGDLWYNVGGNHSPPEKTKRESNPGPQSQSDRCLTYQLLHFDSRSYDCDEMVALNNMWIKYSTALYCL
jgi:hypothetical protein